MNRIQLVRLGFLLLMGVMGAVDVYPADTYREAYDAGFADGRSVAQADRDAGRAYDFANKRLYQLADRGFDSDRHVRDVYIVAYRRGFEDGYEAGFGIEDHGPRPVSVVASQPVDQPRQPPAQMPAPVPTLTSGDVKLPAGAEIRVKLLNTLSTEFNERGDEFQVEVTDDVMIGPDRVVPSGTRIHGTITYIKRAGRIKGRSEMNLRFDRIEFAGRTEVPIEATLVSIEERAREEVKDEEGTVKGPGTKSEDATKIGIASGLGALIGILTGGRSGARGGAVAGAAAGVAGVLLSRGEDIYLYSYTELTIKMDREAVIPRETLQSRP